MISPAIREEFEEAVDLAREILAPGDTGRYDAEVLVKDFAETLVQLADACAFGLPCERHGGVVHGQEAEELRAGVELILCNTAEVQPDEAADVLAGLRKSLIFLLDRIDARDSLAFREATPPPDEGAAPPA